MSDAFLTVLHKWYIPRVGVRRIVVTTLEGNEASAGMFQRNGFKFRKTVKGCVDVRGTLQGVHVLEWNYEEESS
jgi:RimJ/RimL family protein N-acetyltransferase